ncbi:ABC-three component system protein [Vreelandella titanicae]|uniref:ABC-three component system protein n=1 Tax=Vreelandella titanicae TaxID=664683 RepID=UPI0011413F63|nr:ABC-three component system protein [Halomonas titanicae]
MRSAYKYKRDILALHDDELEAFVRDWVSHKKRDYLSVTNFGGGGDLGRDVVGFLTSSKHEGAWHNYQCKQYNKSLSIGKVFVEIGKVLYYSYKGSFTAPEKFIIVAPKGVSRPVEELIYKPSEFKEVFIKEWDKHCGNKKIISSEQIPLDMDFEKFINNYDFGRVEVINLEGMLSDESIVPVIYSWFGDLLSGPPPKGVIPDEVDEVEFKYTEKLLLAYNERYKVGYKEVDEIKENADAFKHFKRQRFRFFDAEAFKRFYRDNTDEITISNLEEDVFYGVVEESEAAHSDALCCVDAVMHKAATINITGPLSLHAGVTVKQGLCHHFANEDKLAWK